MPDNIFATLGIPDPVTAEGMGNFVNFICSDVPNEHCRSFNNDCARCLTALIESYAAMRVAEADRRWIPVTESLPEIRTYVLAYHSPGIVIAGLTSDRKWYGLCEVHGITHWMPLPQPPKE